MTDTRTRTEIRAVPRLGADWVRASGAVSGLLLDLLHEPEVAAPLRTVRPALRAWGRLATALRAAQRRFPTPGSPCPDLCLVAVSPADVDTLGVAARALGRAMIPGCERGTYAALTRAADAVDSTPQQLVVALARMHGVLDLDLGTDGELLHLLAGIRTRGTGGEVGAANRRVTERVTEMWRAGAPDDEECHR
ncbi:MAG: hypothetical protein ABW212_10475 [Pseudonocardia sediminis]